MMDNLNKLQESIERSIQENTFVKMSLGNYKGEDETLKNIYVKRVLIKNQQNLSFTYRHKTKDIVKNYSLEEAIDIIRTSTVGKGFRLVTLFTLEYDLAFELHKNDNWILTQRKPSTNVAPPLEHDKQKNRKIEAAGKRYLHELKITDDKGVVYKHAQDKFRQINHYVEILSSLLKELPERPITNVVDMGAGKGYLTFALYDYLNNVINKPANLIGVEFRKDMVDLGNTVARHSNFNNLQFVEDSIDQYENPDIHVLIALHACDTATDDAIYKGITSNADLIVVAPCCHKQIRREIEKHKAVNELDFLTKHGIFLERQAEMVTDGIRALVLEYFGYSTKVFEFISDAHTPKNVLVVGLKRQHDNIDKIKILEKIAATKSFFGIGYHHLEKMMGLLQPAS